MKRDASAPTGLRLTLRHQMIAVAYFALLAAGLGAVLDRPAADVGLALARWVLLASPWLLGALVWAFDCKGPQRDWAAAGLFFSTYPLLALYLDLSTALGAAQTGSLPRPWALGAFNALIAVSSFTFYRRMRTVPCPTCERRSLIPLVRLTGQSRRLNQTHWCASCGGLFWRDRARAWRVEKRMTWVVSPPGIAAAGCVVDPVVPLGGPGGPALSGDHPHPALASTR